jgi:hypothetical protein
VRICQGLAEDVPSTEETPGKGRHSPASEGNWYRHVCRFHPARPGKERQRPGKVLGQDPAKAGKARQQAPHV